MNVLQWLRPAMLAIRRFRSARAARLGNALGVGGTLVSCPIDARWFP
jgi:hypothetical protein